MLLWSFGALDSLPQAKTPVARRRVAATPPSSLLGASINRGPQNKSKYIMVLIIGTTKMGPLICGNSHIKPGSLLTRILDNPYVTLSKGILTMAQTSSLNLAYTLASAQIQQHSADEAIAGP